MKECFGYIRVSSMRQGEGVSLEAQQDAIRAFAERHQIAITQWFEEKETAAKTGRPVFDTMVRELKAGKASGVVIHKIDRSARNPRDWLTISELSDAGVDVHFATESLDFRSRGGRLTADIQAVISADYIRNLSMEARKGINGRLKQGIYPFPAPLGYIDTGKGNPKALDPIRAPLMCELFEHYLTGNHSIRSLHQRMVKRGLTTRANRPISKHTVEHVLQNPFYCGLMRNGRTGELFPGVHERLLTTAQFERIQAIKSGRYVKKVTRHDFLLRRLFRCAQCNTVLTPERQKNRYTYYRCHTPGCPAKTVREEVLEAAVLAALKQAELSQADLTEMDAATTNWCQASHIDEEDRALKLRLSQTEARLDRLTDLLIDEKIDKEAHDRKRTTLQLEIEKLKEERQNLANRASDKQDCKKFFELVKTLATLYRMGNPPEKRLLVQNCFSNCTWDGKYVALEPSELVQWAKNRDTVPYGGAFRDTVRKFIGELDEMRGEAELDDVV